MSNGLKKMFFWGVLFGVCLSFSHAQLPEPPIKAKFEQKRHLAFLSKPLSSSGYYEYSAESGLRWHTEAPLQSTLRVTPTGETRIIDANGHAQVLPGGDYTAGLFLALFSKDEELLSSLFSVSSSAAEAAPGLTSLVPKSEAVKQHIKRVDIRDEAGSFYIVLHMPSGDRTEIRLSES